MVVYYVITTLWHILDILSECTYITSQYILDLWNINTSRTADYVIWRKSSHIYIFKNMFLIKMISLSLLISCFIHISISVGAVDCWYLVFYFIPQYSSWFLKLLSLTKNITSTLPPPHRSHGSSVDGDYTTLHVCHCVLWLFIPMWWW